MWESQLSPTERSGHLFSTNANTSLHFHLWTSLTPALKSHSQGNATSLRTIPRILSLGLFLYCAATRECQRATTADTDGSSCLWWLPYVTLLLWFFFLVLFSFHLSSPSLFWSLKSPELGGRGEHRWGWRGSNLTCVKTFSWKSGHSVQAEWLFRG